MLFIVSALLIASAWIAAGLFMSRDLRSSRHRAVLSRRFGTLNVCVWPVFTYPLFPFLNRLAALRQKRLDEGPLELVTIVYEHPGVADAVRRELYEKPRANTPFFSVMVHGDLWVEMLLGDARRHTPGIVQSYRLERTTDRAWLARARPWSTLTQYVRYFRIELDDPFKTVVPVYTRDKEPVSKFLTRYLDFVNKEIDGINARLE